MLKSEVVRAQESKDDFNVDQRKAYIKLEQESLGY